MNANYRMVAPPPRRAAIGGYPKIASYDMLDEQLHYSKPCYLFINLLDRSKSNQNHFHVCAGKIKSFAMQGALNILFLGQLVRMASV